MNKICKISLISLIAVCSMNAPVSAKISIRSGNNRSYADAYNQVAAVRYQQEYADSMKVSTSSATGNLPVAVDDKKLAAEILNNASAEVSKSDLERCAMIYPNGVFRWGIPESGVRRTPVPQCVSVVELRDINTKAVLATTTIAAGDTMKCNVDSFPESGYSYDLKYGKVTVPADEAPTMADVEEVMNQEQKQNAGFKIAAATILSGVAGNILAPKQPGDDKLMGTSSTQILDTFIGASAGAGIMAASVYSGKVAGDTIKSTAVNAASGMIVGNMLGGMSGDSEGVLATVKCEPKGQGEKDCIIGTARYINTSVDNFTEWKGKQKLLDVTETKCKGAKAEADSVVLVTRTGSSLLICNPDIECCKQVSNQLVKIKVNSKLLSSFKSSDENNATKYCLSQNEDQKKIGKYVTTESLSDSSCEGNLYYKVSDADYSDKKDAVYAVFNSLKIKPLGYKKSDWEELEKLSPTYYYKNTDGSVGDLVVPGNNKELVFEPTLRDAGDGNLVDISNEARAKATLVGTTAGGALGGLAGYQGAKSEIAERWTAAVREYNDSLSNYACATGGRFLSSYNSYVDIPELKDEE